MPLTSYEQYAVLAQTTLSAGMTAGQMTLPVVDDSEFTGMGVGRCRILIDLELFLVETPVAPGLVWTILARGIEGTTPAPHILGALVTQVGTRSSLLNLPRSMTVEGDSETLNSVGAVVSIPRGLPGQSIAAPGISGLGPLQYTAHRGLSPMDYGAVADGTSHPLSELYGNLAAAQVDFPFVTALTQQRDWAALQRILDIQTDAGGTNVGGDVYIPAGDYYLDAPLEVHQSQGMCIHGDGDATQLVYHGPGGSGCLLLSCCMDCHVRMLRIRTPDLATVALYGIWLTNEVTTNGYVSTSNHFYDVEVLGSFTRAVWVEYGAQGDANNDLHTFDSCEFTNYTTYGVYLRGGQAHDLRFMRCTFVTFLGPPTGTYAFRSIYGGYVHFDKCNFNNHETILRIDDFFAGPVTITRCNGELNRKICDISPGGFASSFPMTISKNRFVLSPQVNDYVIALCQMGPVNIEDNTIASDTNVLPLIGAFGGCWSLRHVGNTWQTGAGSPRWSTTSGGAYKGYATFSHPTLSLEDHGNLYYDSDGFPYRFDTLAGDRRTPPALTGDVNDYQPQRGYLQRWSSTVIVNVTGMESDPGNIPNTTGLSNPISGETRYIYNVGSFNIVLKHLSALSLASNQFNCSSGGDLILTPGTHALVQYDYDDGCWRTSGPF